LHSYHGVHADQRVHEQKSGPLAQDYYCAEEVEEQSRRNGVETEKNKYKSSSCDVDTTCVDVPCFL